MSARLAALALLAAGAAAAQMPLPSETISRDSRAQFQECRVAVFYHLDGALPRDARVPRAVAETMREQLTYIMMETIKLAPGESVAEYAQALDFVEGFFLTFSQAIAENRDRFRDVALREKVLLDCQPLIWAAMKERIDYLLRWRARAVDAPESPAETAQ